MRFSILSGSVILRGMKVLSRLLRYVPCETGSSTYSAYASHFFVSDDTAIELWQAENAAYTSNHDLHDKFYVPDVHAMIAQYYSLPKDRTQAQEILDKQESETKQKQQVRQHKGTNHTC